MLARSGAEVTELAARAVGEKAAAVVAAGGDGTLSAVASRLVGMRTALGVIPLGTLNHFAKDLKILPDLEGAVQNIIAGHTIEIDVGEVNGRIFLNNVSLGLYPSIVKERERQQRWLRVKVLALIAGTVTVLRRYPFFSVRLLVDNQQLMLTTPFVFVGNNKYEIEGFNIGSRARLDAGLLSLHMAQNTGRLRFLKLCLRALMGSLHDSRKFQALYSKEVSIETRRKKMRVAIDGEVTTMKTPLHCRIFPKALRVIVPEGSCQVESM